jgi:hypothetical protein
LAAIIYGFTGLVMNNRFGDNAWPQGTTDDAGRTELRVPATARATPEELSLWLQTQGLDAQVIRKGGKDKKGPMKWNFSGGTASASWSVEYAPGSDTAEVKRSRHSFLAAITRLHKGSGGGWAWNLLADSFAIGMLLLGLSGIWMWARGRSVKDMVASIFGLSLLVLLAVLVPALV